MRLVRMKEGCPIYLSTNVYFFSSLLQVLAVALAYFVVAASADCGLLGKWRNVNEYYENTTLVTYETNREFASTMTETVKVTAGALCTSNTLSAVFNYQNYQSDFSMIQYQRTSCSVDVAGCGTCAQPTTGAETYTFSSNCNKVTFEVNGKRTTYDNTYRPPTPPPTTPVPTTAAPTTAAPTTPVPTTAAPTHPPPHPPPPAPPPPPARPPHARPPPARPHHARPDARRPHDPAHDPPPDGPPPLGGPAERRRVRPHRHVGHHRGDRLWHGVRL